jgi:amino acid adenylation domain-containing protein
MNDNIIQRIKKNVEICPDKLALEVESYSINYFELWEKSSKIAELLRYYSVFQQNVGILAYRSLSTYTGILGALISGNTYLPFNPKFPNERIYKMIKSANARAFIVGKEFVPILSLLENQINEKLLFIAPEIKRNDLPLLKSIMICSEDFENIKSNDKISPVGLEDIAYLIFTSGTTGEPKGIPISHKNLINFIDMNQKNYPLSINDRCSQAFPTTFDCSVQDIFATWNAGSCLVCVPETDLFAPARFINEKNLTVWYSVPSVAMFMKRMNILKENIFPSLRFSLFCGEALNEHIAVSWQKAAPNSLVVNLYGPAENTIAITNYTWKNEFNNSVNGIVPLGKVYPTHDFLIVDDDLNPVGNNEPGELLISGPQVSSGYLNDDILTSKKFIKLKQGGDKVWYRTGDIVKEDESEDLHFLGRMDHQVKIRGYRVELEEVEKVVREASGRDFAVALSYPFHNPVAESIVVVLEDGKFDAINIISFCKTILPDYMIPKDIIAIPFIPLNNNGKIDKNKIISMLKENHGN